MKITIKINTDNDAFGDGPRETARILRKLADGCPLEPGKIRDINGNTVGSVEVSE
jgi:hypothetical protein